MKDIKNLLEIMNEAQNEIHRLRHANEILSAKVEMIDLFACVLYTRAPEHKHNMSEDIAWKLQKQIDEIAEKFDD